VDLVLATKDYMETPCPITAMSAILATACIPFHVFGSEEKEKRKKNKSKASEEEENLEDFLEPWIQVSWILKDTLA
jgi:hypothetical protein